MTFCRSICCTVFLLLIVGCDSGKNKDATVVAGEKIYRQRCLSCHLVDGTGVERNSPPLAGSPRVNGEPSRLVTLVLRGMRGPQTYNGITYNGVMPAWKSDLDSKQVAQVLTYIRQAWGNSSPPVTWEYVDRIRKQAQVGPLFPSPTEIDALPVIQP